MDGINSILNLVDNELKLDNCDIAAMSHVLATSYLAEVNHVLAYSGDSE
jgi:hypothetical protein